ncbi:type II secretion system protein GspM [Scandinavium sp. M-37]|uniref:type II secretion system protein GspM n=1 Tax=Scandinavium sp. M-37 TaxID=3373077 RepID=UPI003747232F
MINWWQGKTLREKVFILLLAGCCLMAGIMYGIVTPLNKGIARLSDENRRLADEIVWLENAAHRKGIVPANPTTATMEQLLANTARQSGIQYKSQKADPQTLSVSLSPLPANTLFTWLQALQRSGLQVTQLEFSAHSAGKNNVKVITLKLRQVKTHG